MASKLSIYNDALLALGERKLASLSESRESRRALDDAYDSGVLYCLERGQWGFAQRISHISPDPNVAPTFGYTNAFAKPDDFVRLTKMCSDEYLNSPLLQYNEEKGYWFSSVSEIYVGYVSKDITYGMDLSRWPETFSSYVSLFLASIICERITQSATKANALEKKVKSALTEAKSNAAIEEGTKFLPPGRWGAARGGSTRRDRGSRGSLIG